MKCPKCLKENKKSKVYVVESQSTAMAGSKYYDEDGRYHRHDPNIHSTTYKCGNNHRWTEGTKSPCWCENPKSKI